MYIVPLSTPAGSADTIENLVASNVTMVSCSLTSLLIKPGLLVLNKLPSLAAYILQKNSLSLKLVLNANMPKPNANGMYTFYSPYDGSRIQYTLDEIFKIIAKLNPDYVILPKEANYHSDFSWLPNSCKAFFHLEERLISEDKLYGYYIPLSKTTSVFDSYNEVMQNKSLPKETLIYVEGDMSLADFRNLYALGVTYVESDTPAADGLRGIVYEQEQALSIVDSSMELQFEVIDKNCKCSTCTQQFTRAYLHHLFLHTPLLCQRLLIQHNLFTLRQNIDMM